MSRRRPGTLDSNPAGNCFVLLTIYNTLKKVNHEVLAMLQGVGWGARAQRYAGIVKLDTVRKNKEKRKIRLKRLFHLLYSQHRRVAGEENGLKGSAPVGVAGRGTRRRILKPRLVRYRRGIEETSGGPAQRLSLERCLNSEAQNYGEKYIRNRVIRAFPP